MGEQLLVSFTDASEQPHSAVEQTLRDSQARELEAARAEAERQQGKELYQVFEQAPAAIVLLRGPDHRIEHVNPAYQQFFPGVALRGRLLVEAHPLVAASGVLARIDGVCETGEPCTGEEQPIRLTLSPDQPAQTRYFNYTYQPYREQGHIVGVSVFAYDVTGAVLVRRQIAEQARQLQELYEQAPMAVCILREPDFIVELANPAILHIWGLTAEESMGRPRLELIPETSRASLRAVLETAYRTHQTHHVQEFPVVLGRSHSGQPDMGYFTRHEHDGQLETVYWDFVYVPLYAADGSTNGVMVVATDTTAQVLARRQVEQLNQKLEARVQRRTAQLTEQQALLRQILGQVPAAIATLTGPEHRYTFFNEAYQQQNAVKYRDFARPVQVWLRAEAQPGAVVLSVQDNGLVLSDSQQTRLFEVFQRLHTHVEGTAWACT